MRKPTIYEIKRATEATQPFYFDRKTMQFWGQTMKSFSVVQTKTGKVFIYAMGKHNNLSIREFTGDTLKHVPGVNLRNLASFLEDADNA